MRILLRLGMTQKQKKYRLFLLKSIHVHPVYKRMHANNEWASFLNEYFETPSSKNLSGVSAPTPKKARKVRSYCEELGWGLQELEEFCLHVCKKNSRYFTKQDTTKLLVGLGKVYEKQITEANERYRPINNAGYIPSGWQ
ncbi:hypothetical protein [Helicobacter suis]|uniref:hypothetical protein n=1 Tax=Helicobacter suis TaxID=104628 RepID=UPI0013D7BA86|nr:hypothetical protein [Helicobacter suis]